MSDNEKQIRTLIERWAGAVHGGDLDTVLADHTDDIVMFDVPPPHDGVRGVDAYRETWPPFFRWQAGGAVFEIVELDVTAGDDVAFAHALLRCDTPDGLARNPETRLRLTIGLRKENGRWAVSHEHHSFASSDDSGDEQEVRDVLDGWSRHTAERDLDGLMATVDTDVVSYELEAPLQYVGADEVREVCRKGLDAPGEIAFDVPDVAVRVQKDLAVTWGLDRVTVDGAPTWSRGTRVFRRTDGGWKLVHQHLSYPVDPVTGRAATDLTP